jgi:ComEC/Rec2-related protein
LFVSAIAAAFGASCLCLRRRPALSLVGIALVGMGAGMMNAQVRSTPRGPLAAVASDVPRCALHGTVLEPIGNLATLVEVHAADCGASLAGSLGVAAMRERFGVPGATFETIGWIVPLARDGSDSLFERAGADVVIHASAVEVVSRPSGVRGVAAEVRRGLATAVSGLDPRAGALIKGLTIGDTSDLGTPTIDTFRRAGLSHILAVSGSNVAIVLGAVLLGLRSIGHRVRIASGYLGLALFVLVVGPDASVLRAAAMGAIALACIAYGRTAEPLAALGLAVIGVIGLRPGMVFSVGMHLSAVATAGIVLFTARIEQRLTRLPVALRTMLAATLAAQIAVAPVLILVFGEFSVIAPIANALALPAVAPATVIGLAAGVLGALMRPVAALMMRLVAPAATWILLVADRAGAISWSLLTVPTVVGWPLMAAVVAWGCHELRRPVEPSR